MKNHKNHQPLECGLSLTIYNLLFQGPMNGSECMDFGPYAQWGSAKLFCKGLDIFFFFSESIEFPTYGSNLSVFFFCPSFSSIRKCWLPRSPWTSLELVFLHCYLYLIFLLVLSKKNGA